VPGYQVQQQIEGTVKVGEMNLKASTVVRPRYAVRQPCILPSLRRRKASHEVDSLRTSSESSALASKSASIAAIASRTIRPRSIAMPY